MIKPYTGPIGSEVDEALYRAEQAGFTTTVLVEEGQGSPIVWVVRVKPFMGMKTTTAETVPNFLREFGKH